MPDLPRHPAAPPAAAPLAEFTLTMSPGEVQVLDHADGSRHTFAHLLLAFGYLEQVTLSRQQARRRGTLL